MTRSPLVFEVFTLFPAAVEAFVRSGLLGRAIESHKIALHCTNFRDFAEDARRSVDDQPFGGGGGMLIRAAPVVAALEQVTAARGAMHRILLTPSAPRFDQGVAERLARIDRIGLVCGRYEGIDDRVREGWVDECLSIGDFVLNGGEVAAAAIIEAVARLRDGVVGNPDSLRGESFAGRGPARWLEHPHYTRPVSFRGKCVPEVLLGGDHEEIRRHRLWSACLRTWTLRPELRAVGTPAPPRAMLLALMGIGAAGVSEATVERLAGRLARLAPHATRCRVLREGRDFEGLAGLRRAARRGEREAPFLVAMVASEGDPGVAGRLEVVEDFANELRGTRSFPLVLVATTDDDGPPTGRADRGQMACDAQLPLELRASDGLANAAAIVDVSRPDWDASLQWVDRALARLAPMCANTPGEPTP